MSPTLNTLDWIKPLIVYETQWLAITLLLSNNRDSGWYIGKSRSSIVSARSPQLIKSVHIKNIIKVMQVNCMQHQWLQYASFQDWTKVYYYQSSPCVGFCRYNSQIWLIPLYISLVLRHNICRELSSSWLRNRPRETNSWEPSFLYHGVSMPY